MKKCLFLAMMTLLIVTALSAQAYRLTYKGAPGTVNTYNIKGHINNTSTVQGNKMDTVMDMTMTLVEKVLAVKPDGNMSISNEIKDGKMKMTLPGSPAGAEPKTLDIPSMSSTFDRTPLGKVSNMVYGGNMAAMQQMKSMNTWMSSLDRRFPGFPDTDLQIGDSWSLDDKGMEVMPGSSVDIKGTMTLAGTKEVDGKTYLVINSVGATKMDNMVIKLPLPANAQDANAAPPQMTLNGTVKVSGTFLFDEQAGEYYNSTADIKFDMQMTIAGSTPMTIPVVMDMEMQMSRAK